ncbi:cyclase family protein [Tuberibacillus sp. Marseille-P3662]|uniref:cyclase family protein n=1 Tax=Tuberibacillus sp. Marseille-P3662 TaxID=1965358 RepID=UPI000A1C7E8F|nr:cyclase family protein [Tuberibacillus sp. Marseille-P3662]
MVKVHDVSLPIYEGMPVYKDKSEKQPQFETTTSGHVTESRFTMDAHTGTHVDAPLHMIEDGQTIESVSIHDLVTPIKLFDLTDVQDGITESDLQNLDIEAGDFILFKTKNSFDTSFNFEFIFLKESGAKYLAEKAIKGVGIDSLGIERSQADHATHRALFTQDIIIIEGLKLDQVHEGRYQMVAAPLKMQSIDAAPARIILMED